MYDGDPDSLISSIRMHIYGPPGIRSFVRFNLSITETNLVGKYAVHELLKKDEQPSVSCSEDLLHDNEAPGMDIVADEDGLWKEFLNDGDWSVDAGQIVHRKKSFSSAKSDVYLPHLDRNAEALREQNIRHPYSLIKTIVNDRKSVTLPDGTVLEPPTLDIPGRKVVVLGDTCEPSEVIPIAMDASILVHESTNAYISKEIAKNIRGLGSSGTPESVRYKAIGRGHSTAEMAGEFAKKIKARRLVLNHFTPSKGKVVNPQRLTGMARAKYDASLVMEELERQASEAWGMGQAVAATDLMTIQVASHE
ncbi:3227_t:CDS:2, partial [Acaulospora colombiana]